MVERVALEKRCARNSTEGSNPSLSAECRVRHIIRYGATSDDVANLPLSAECRVHHIIRYGATSDLSRECWDDVANP